MYEPASSPLGQVVIHGAAATQQRYYGAWSRHLAWRGFRVLTYDYRGIGRSRVDPIERDPTTMSDWIDDANAAQRWLVELGPHLPLSSVGHSFGGQVAPLLTHAGRPDAIVIVGSGSGLWRGSPGLLAAQRWLLWSMVLPAACRSFGYLPGWLGLGEDMPSGVARQWARWCTSSGYYLSDNPQLRSRLEAYDGDVLALSFSDDDYAPLPNVRWLLDRLGGARVEHQHLEPADVGLRSVGHFGFFRATAVEQLWPRAVRALLNAARAARHGEPPRMSTAMQDIMADLHYGRG